MSRFYETMEDEAREWDRRASSFRESAALDTEFRDHGGAALRREAAESAAEAASAIRRYRRTISALHAAQRPEKEG